MMKNRINLNTTYPLMVSTITQLFLHVCSEVNMQSCHSIVIPTHIARNLQLQSSITSQQILIDKLDPLVLQRTVESCTALTLIPHIFGILVMSTLATVDGIKVTTAIMPQISSLILWDVWDHHSKSRIDCFTQVAHNTQDNVQELTILLIML